MKESDWKKIKERQDDLLKDLQPSCLVSNLYQVGVFDDDDQERINMTGITRRDKVVQLLEILRTKELPDRDIYAEFIKQLRETSQPFLADRFKPPGKARKRTSKHAETEANIKTQNDSYLRSMNVDELAQFLLPVLEKCEIDKKVLTSFKEERITGRVFLGMSVSDLKEVCGYLVFGDRKTILLERDTYIAENQQTAIDVGEINVDTVVEREYARKFNTDTGYTEQYHKGKILQKLQCYPGTSMEPVDLCIPLDILDAESALETIAWETVKFGAACMNARTNGTLHFGVHDGSEDDHLHGEIAGITELHENDCGEAVESWIGKCFSPEQNDVAKKCIHPAKDIDVVSNEKCHGFVIEIDIEPKALLVKEEVFFVQDQYIEKGQKKAERQLFRLDSGHAHAEDGEGVIRYNSQISTLTQLRREAETKVKQHQSAEPLMKRLQDVFCNGGRRMGNVYPILVINAMSTSGIEPTEDLSEMFSFIADIDWLCVLDFDSTGHQRGIYDHLTRKLDKSYKVMLIDDFDKHNDSHPQLKQDDEQIQEEMEASNLQPWIFCNGYEPMDKGKLDLLEWKTQRSEGFKEALRYFSHRIPKDRAMVVYLLLSKDYTVMLDAAEELSLKFQNQWALLAEVTPIIAEWKKHLIGRKVVKASCLESRCITGFKWTELNTCMKDIIGVTEYCSSKEECLLVTYCGALVTLPKITQNEMCDLDILSADDGMQVEDETDDNRTQAEKDVEKQFYEGHPPTWLNFSCSSHVLRREIHNDLLSRVTQVLNGDIPDNEYIGRVTIYHQPGSGGTTTAMQVLWDLKKKYKCCILKQYSKESHSQIEELWLFEASNVRKRPVLVLIDNMEEEHLEEFVRSLHRYAEANIEDTQQVFCVLLICQRQTSPPIRIDRGNFALKQELEKVEQNWFQTKHNALSESFKRKKGPNPKHLIAFNIMKENFSEAFIKKTVTKIINGEMTTDEKDLLTHVSLLNTYDKQYRGIPVACFDHIMQRRYHIPGSKWELNLSSPLTMLLARCKSGQNVSLRVISPLLSKWILGGLLEMQNKNLADTLLELLHSKPHTAQHRDVDVASRYLFNILRDLMKVREQLPTGKLSMFSRLIQELYDSKYVDDAADILQLMFEITNDPFIAQQLARLYSVCQNWEKATYFANEGTDLRPNSSYLLDTCGQILKLRLTQIHSTGLANKDTRVVVQKATELAYDATRLFIKVQDLSVKEPSSEPNMAGYVGEVDTYISLLDTLSLLPVFEQKSEFQRFINGRLRIPEELSLLNEEQLNWLLSLQGNAWSTLRKLEDEADRVQPDKITERSRNARYLQKGNLDKLRRGLGKYFGDEDVLDVTTIATLSPDKARRQVRGLGLNSLQSIFRLQRDDQSKEKVPAIYKAMQKNSNDPKPLPYDCRMALGSALALVQTQREDLLFDFLNYDDILRTSWTLYSMKHELNYVDLEPYLFFVLFHWPTRQRVDYREKVDIIHLANAIEKWKDAFSRKYPNDKQNKGYPFVFITKERGIKSVIHIDQLRKWLKFRQPSKTMKIDHILGGRENQLLLQHFDGTLSGNGWEVLVRVVSQAGNALPPVRIQTHTRGQPSLRNKKVYFSLGFGWSGPRACYVQSSPPDGHRDVVQRQTMQNHDASAAARLDQDLFWNIAAIDEELRQIADIKRQPWHRLSVRERQLIGHEVNLVAHRGEIIRARREMSLQFL